MTVIEEAGRDTLLDVLVVGGRSISSRLIMGTGGAPTWRCSSGRWSRPAPS